MKNYSDSEFFDSPFRGVTSVLNAIFGNKFENSGIPEHILKAAGERGTAVHKYIEDWLNWYKYPIKRADEIEPHLGLEYAVYETVWKEWLDERIEWDIQPIHTELKLINKKLGVKGIIDCIAMVNGKMCMIDWKTSSNLDEWTTNCQLQLYYMMLCNGNKEEKALAKQIEELRKEMKKYDEHITNVTESEDAADTSWYDSETGEPIKESKSTGFQRISRSKAK